MRIVWGYLKCRCWPLLLLGACTGVFAWVRSEERRVGKEC